MKTATERMYAFEHSFGLVMGLASRYDETDDMLAKMSIEYYLAKEIEYCTELINSIISVLENPFSDRACNAVQNEVKNFLKRALIMIGRVKL